MSEPIVDDSRDYSDDEGLADIITGQRKMLATRHTTQPPTCAQTHPVVGVDNPATLS